MTSADVVNGRRATRIYIVKKAEQQTNEAIARTRVFCRQEKGRQKPAFLKHVRLVVLWGCILHSAF